MILTLGVQSDGPFLWNLFLVRLACNDSVEVNTVYSNRLSGSLFIDN